MPGFEVTHARVFAIAGPAMLANLTTPLLGIVGTAVIGRLGEAHLLGAVAMSALVFDCIFWVFGFLRMGTVALTAQALGAGDTVEQRAVLARALLIAAAIGFALIALQAPLAAVIYALMGGSDAVTEAAQAYFFVRIWSAPFALGKLRRARLAGRPRPHRHGAGPADRDQRDQHGRDRLLVLYAGYGVEGAALGSVMAGVAGSRRGPRGRPRAAARPGGLRLAQRARPRQARAHAGDQSRHHDPHLRADRSVRVLHRAGRAGGRHAARRQRGAAQFHPDRQLFPRRVRHRRASSFAGSAIGARDRAAFDRRCGCVLGWGFGFGVAATLLFLAGGNGADRRDDRKPRGAQRGAQFHDVGGAGAGGRRAGLCLSTASISARPGRATCAT